MRSPPEVIYMKKNSTNELYWPLFSNANSNFNLKNMHEKTEKNLTSNDLLPIYILFWNLLFLAQSNKENSQKSNDSFNFILKKSQKNFTLNDHRNHIFYSDKYLCTV